MLKLSHACHSKRIQTNNKIQWKSDKGITLIELLASLAILSIVILLAGSVNIFGQKQFINQTQSASQANDMSYALSVMSRDLRKEEAGAVSVTEVEDGKEITTNSGLTFTYINSKNQLRKNGTVLVDAISSAEFEKNDNNIKIILKNNSPQVKDKSYQTTIYFRR